MVATSLGCSSRVKTFTASSPPTVTKANFPPVLSTQATWLVIGPVSSTVRTLNERPSITVTLPTSLWVIHTWSSEHTSRLGENGLVTAMRATTWWDFTSTATASGVKLETTNPTAPSPRKRAMPGPSGTPNRPLSRIVAASITET